MRSPNKSQDKILQLIGVVCSTEESDFMTDIEIKAVMDKLWPARLPE